MDAHVHYHKRCSSIKPVLTSQYLGSMHEDSLDQSPVPRLQSELRPLLPAGSFVLDLGSESTGASGLVSFFYSGERNDLDKIFSMLPTQRQE